MNARKAIGLALGAIALFFLITQPVDAAAVVRGVLDALESGATAIITFAKNLFS
jgi:hypothetical protein